MIVSKTDIESYIKFLEKALGNRRGYKESQKQEIIQQFSVAGFINLESLFNRNPDELSNPSLTHTTNQ